MTNARSLVCLKIRVHHKTCRLIVKMTFKSGDLEVHLCSIKFISPNAFVLSWGFSTRTMDQNGYFTSKDNDKPDKPKTYSSNPPAYLDTFDV
jgi:hypothetical protein